jgi:transposase
MILALFPNNDASIHKAKLFSHDLKSIKVNSPNLNNIEPLWSVLETSVRNRFPPPASVKQPEDALQEEWYKIPLETVQNLYKSIPRRIVAVLKAY